jgi:Fe-S-cluster containining protein
MDGAIEALYREVDAELRALGASCDACGRCCRFAEFGHELWVTNLELSYLLARHGRRGAAAAGACPYLDGDRCSARTGRALACRTFHCSLSRDVVEEITNRYFERLRALARAEGLPIEYSGLFGQAGTRPCTNL